MEPTAFFRVINALNADSNNNRKIEASKRCLFGKPDMKDTERLLKEQCENNKKRFRDRFGIDIENIENVCENVKREEVKLDSRKGKVKRTTGKRAAGERPAFRPYNKQLKLTGGCTIFCILYL